MKFKYYKAIGERAEEVKQKIKSEQEKCFSKRRDLMKKYSAEGLLIRGNDVIAVTYINKFDCDDDAFKFLARNESLEKHSKEKCYAYEPNRRYKKGKELYEDMKRCKSLDTSNYACSYYGVGTTVLEYLPKTLGCLYVSVGWINGNGDLVFKIPCDKKQNERFPQIPDDLVEITEDEFNAGAEKDE